MEALYQNYIRSRFDLKALSQLPYKIGFDAMYGAGQRIFPRLLPNVHAFRCTYNPSFGGINPEPIPKTSATSPSSCRKRNWTLRLF